MHPLTDTEQKLVETIEALGTDIENLQKAMREKQAVLRTTTKERHRVREETLGSWVRAAGLGEVEPALLKPGLLALAAVMQNPTAYARFCEEWLTAQERAGLQTAAA